MNTKFYGNSDLDMEPEDVALATESKNIFATMSLQEKVAYMSTATNWKIASIFQSHPEHVDTFAKTYFRAYENSKEPLGLGETIFIPILA